MDKKKKIMAGAGAAVIILAGAAFFLTGKGAKGGQGGPGGMGGPDGMMQESTVTVVNAANPTTGDVSVTSSLTGGSRCGVCVRQGRRRCDCRECQGR